MNLATALKSTARSAVAARIQNTTASLPRCPTCRCACSSTWQTKHARAVATSTRRLDQVRLPAAAYSQARSFSQSSHRPIVTKARSKPVNFLNKDRGPVSKEETQTDFAALNVLGGAEAPSTSVDICEYDGFVLNSGLRIGDGDGVLLTSGDAFVWRPWLANAKVADAAQGEAARPRAGIVSGEDLRRQGTHETQRSGGILNGKGQFELPEGALGLLALLQPKPDLLILGTGGSIRPLAPSTRDAMARLGLRVEVLDTRNAAATFNMMAVERGIDEIAAILLPLGFGQ